MKTNLLNVALIAGFMAVGATVMAQDSTETKTNEMMSNDMMTKDAMSTDQQKVPKMMKKMDTNSDGMISMDEAKAAKNQKLSENFSEADTSQDGMIDTSEFMAFHKNMKNMKKDGMKDEKMDDMQQTDSTDY